MSSDISSVSGAGGGVAPSVLQIKARNLVRAPTPDTIYTERQADPDISIFCEKCHEYVSVRATQEHRGFHSALIALGYTEKQQPESVKALLKRRQILIKDLNKKTDADNPAPYNRLQKINEAYELVKAHLEDTYDELIHSKEKLVYDCKGISLNCSAPCVRAVGFCSHDNSRWKSKMEDTRVFQDYFGNDVNKCFFAIYDGYNGRFTADLAANDLHHIFLNELQKVDDSVSCTCTVNLADKNDLTEYALDRDSLRVRSDSIRHILHEESVSIIQQIMHTCESNLVKLTENDEQDLESERPMRKKKSRDPEAEKFGLAFHKAYNVLDRYFAYGINETSLVRWSGCSALTLVIQSEEDKLEEDKALGDEAESKDPEEENAEDREEEDKKADEKKDEEKKEEEEEDEEGGGKESPQLQELGVIHLANAGNTHALLCRAGQAYRLSKDHTGKNANEKVRVQKAGSSIQAGRSSGRVNGILDTTRGLGNYGDPHLKKAVIPDPYTTSVKIDQFAEFIVMASCGLWEVLTDDDIVSLVKQTLALRQARTTTATVPDEYGQEMSEVTTFGEDFGASFDIGLGASLGLGNQGFEDAAASVIDIDAAEDADGSDQKLQFKNPPLKQAVDDASDEDDNSKSKINWDEPLTNGGTDQQGGSNAGEKDVMSQRSERDKGRERSTATPTKNYKDEFNDAESTKTDFESMMSALCDDGNEADVETLTELHTFYARSRLSEGFGLVDKKEEYRMTAELISERLVQSALMAGSRDNITVMVILLEGCQL